ncbi:MAG: HAMP domain-containing protein [Deltaproteobacteria bacterium]|nr:MAG: HAMP domain-containing protein [Deltaproteobacteria bacterium]
MFKDREDGEIRFSLRFKCFAFIMGGIIALSLIYGWYYLSQSKEILVEDLKDKGISLTKTIAKVSSLRDIRDNQTILPGLIDELTDELDVAYAVVSDREKKVLQEAFKNRELVEEKETIYQMSTAFREPEIKDFFSRDGEHFYNISAATKYGLVQIGISRESVDKEFGRLKWYGVIISLLICGLGVGLAFLFMKFFAGPITEIAHKGIIIANGDLTQSIEFDSRDEIGLLARTFNQIGSNLNSIFKDLKGVGKDINEITEKAGTSLQEVLEGLNNQTTSVTEATSSIDEINISIKGIAENTEILSNSAEDSSSSILQMGASIEEVSQGVENLSTSVDETTSSISEMTISIKEVANNVENLLKVTEETASAMVEMDTSIKEIGVNAEEAAKLSELVTKNANVGMEAVQSTVAGIYKIQASSWEAAEVIQRLGERTQEIGNILSVIDGVASQTNLLALNAAIIASQAGEQGKGFAVVADEIKDLADRTRASTKEIAQLIESVQEEAQSAVKAMEAGSKSVREGVELAKEAGEALNKISESARESTDRGQEIASATIEQSNNSHQVTEAIERIAEMVQQIARSTQEQAKGSEQIMRASETMRDFTQQVRGSINEQTRSSKHITQSIENMVEMVNFINKATQEQGRSSELVVKAGESIQGISKKNMQSITELDKAVEIMSQQVKILREVVERFRM